MQFVFRFGAVLSVVAAVMCAVFAAHAAEVTCSDRIPADVLKQMAPQFVQQMRQSDGRVPFAKRAIWGDSGAREQFFSELTRAAASGEGLCLSILLRGEIQHGDYEQLRKLVVGNPWISEIDLISRGGDLEEAMKIGHLIRSDFIQTKAPELDTEGNTFLFAHGISCQGADCICASACFFIWAGGVHREGNAVGLHRPSFGQGYVGHATDAQSEYVGAVKEVRAYLEQMEVPAGYVDLLLRTNSKEIVFLGTMSQRDGDLQDIIGYPPSIDEWLNTVCESMTPEEEKYYKTAPTDSYISNKHWGTLNCRTGALTEARTHSSP